MIAQTPQLLSAEPHVNYWGSIHISGMAEARAIKFGT